MMPMLSQKHHYLSSLRDAQAFISMDPNLLRFPEVVLERIEVKIEDDSPRNTEGQEERPLQDLPVKSEKDWSIEKCKPQEKIDTAAHHCPAGTEDGAVYQGAENSKKYQGKITPAESEDAGYEEPGRELLRSGVNGETRQIGKSPGRKKRGGWHQYVHRDRQQFDRKLKRNIAIYVEEERQRGQRFSEEENAALVEGVLSYYKELCGYSSLKGSASKKRRIWQEVVNTVNSVGTAYRTIEVCKKRYGDCKRAVKLKMAALEHKGMGWGGPQEPIKFNNWEERLKQKIMSVSVNGAQQVLDTCKPSSPELCDSKAPSTTHQQCSSWAPTVETAAAQFTQPLTCEPVSDYEEGSSPLDSHLISEWSEEEAPCTPAAPVPNERATEAEPPPEYGLPVPSDITPAMIEPETLVTAQQLQEVENKSLQHLTQAHDMELHKLRQNVVEGNGRIVQQLEGLVSEVRELNAHVQQIHVNQTHFNHMFQNYISDTKQFYGAIVQAIKALQPVQTISPMASPASSPVPSPKHTAVQNIPNPMLVAAAMIDSTSLSPEGSAEPASASSTPSECNPRSRSQGQRQDLNFQS